MADVEKLQPTTGIFDYPDASDPSKGTTEQQYQEWVRNHHNVLNDVVAAHLWQPNKAYNVGEVVESPNMIANTVARVITAGTTSNAEPAWSAAGNVVGDGTVTWAILYRTIDYATQEEVTAGTNKTKIVTPAMLGKTIKTDLASENAGTLNAADKTVVGGVTGILQVSHGGTGTDSLANVTVGKAGTLAGDAGLWNYLHRLGINPTLPTTNAALNALGVFLSYFTQKDKIANQPGQYGQLLNLPADKGSESTQLWIEQPTGRMYHRGGNGAIAINDTPFKRFLDTDDLSAAGVVAGDVSNANAWWVKLGGAVPLIIQGGFSSGYITYQIAFSSFSSVVVQGKQSGGACEFRVWNTSKTGFQTAGDRETQGLFWIAMGY
nr:MAG TPA: hypothetical protein [Caudoviricetes sp.]